MHPGLKASAGRHSMLIEIFKSGSVPHKTYYNSLPLRCNFHARSFYLKELKRNRKDISL
jgi:hypothetical protein